MIEKRVQCVYTPKCNADFARKGGMMQHVKNVHGTPDRLFCAICPALKFYENNKALNRHMKTHEPPQPCEYCGRTFGNSYLQRHARVCPDRGLSSDLHDSSTQGDDVTDHNTKRQAEQLFRGDKTDLTRSSHHAPKIDLLQQRLPGFVEWVCDPRALGKHAKIKNTTEFLNKFRTALGKLAKTHDIPMSNLFLRLNGKKTCENLFAATPLSKFVSRLGKTDAGRDLQSGTLYNYLRPVIVFLRWKIRLHNMNSLRQPVKDLEEICEVLNSEKKRERDPAEKAARMAKLPDIPALVAFIKEDLYPKMIEAKTIYFGEEPFDKWAVYVPARDYILAATLLIIPPQRKQILQLIDVKKWKRYGGAWSFYVKDHKTSYLYGDVNLIYPPQMFDDLQFYLRIRHDIAASTSVRNLFLNHEGQFDKYITKRFQKLVYDKFKVNVTVRDCRSLYINYASKHMDMTQLHGLARQMVHSFQVQQTIYRSDEAIIRSFEATQQAQQLPVFMPMMITQEGPQIEEIEDEDDDGGCSGESDSDWGGEFDDVPDDVFTQVVELYNSSHTDKI